MIEFEGEMRPSVGRIALLRELGRGGMGVVYLGINPRLRTEVAVKVLPSGLQVGDEPIVERFVQEARIAANLPSPHLVNVLDVDRDEASGAHFIVMEYVHGKSARDWVEDLEAVDRKVPERSALEVCIAATRGLKAAHLEGILHRDLKPHNIMIPVSPEGQLLFDLAKLADLGLARPEVSEEELTTSKIGMGTPGYVSPEQARDARTATKCSDVFGMCATLYATLCNKAPFRGSDQIDTLMKTIQGRYTPVPEIRPDVSKPTVAIIDRCLAPKPEDRFQDSAALLDAMEVAYNALTQRDTGEHTMRELAVIAKQAERGKKVARPPRLRAPVRTAAPVFGSRGWFGKGRRGLWIGLGLAGVFALVAAAFLLKGDSGQSAPGLFIASTPAGATVRIDGVVKGVTPLTLADVTGDHEVRLEKKGYAPFIRSRVRVANERVDLNAVLVRLKTEGMLVIETTPDGAQVTIDGRERGLTPLRVTELDEGRHSVTVTLAGYETLEKVITFRAEKSQELSWTLKRQQTLFVLLGPPNADVALTGDPSRTFKLDDTGRAERKIPWGRYKLRVTCDAFHPYETEIDVSGPRLRHEARPQEKNGRLTIATDPAGADVLVDDNVVGRTPLDQHALPPGTRVIAVRLNNHFERTWTEHVQGNKTLDLGVVTLEEHARLGLSALEPGVSAFLDGEQVKAGALIRHGDHVVTLTREGFAPQTVKVTVGAGLNEVRAVPWDAFQARLHLEPRPKGARFFIGDEEIKGTLVTRARSETVSISIEREGYERVRLQIPLALGKTSRLPPDITWQKYRGRGRLRQTRPGRTLLDLSDFPYTTVFRARNTSYRHGDAIAPGSYRGELKMPGYLVRDVEIVARRGRLARPAVPTLDSEALRLALKWLASQQPDGAGGGRWTTVEGTGGHAVGVSGLALLCFLRAGSTHEDGLYKETVRKGLEALIALQDEQGRIGGPDRTAYQYNHACAALAIAEAYRLTGDEKLRPVVEKAVRFALAEHVRGAGWRYEHPDIPPLVAGVPDKTDTIATGWMVRMLVASQDIIDLDATLADARKWFDGVADPRTGRTGYRSREERAERHGGRPPSEADFPARKTESCTAVAVLARIVMGPDKESEALIRKGAKLCRAKLPLWKPGGSIDMHYWYFGTLVAYHVGGSHWARWSRALVNVAEKHQVKNGKNAGSWDPVGAWGNAGGRVYSTAMMTLSLAHAYRYERLKVPDKASAVPSWARVSKAQIAAAARLRVPVAVENDIGMRFVLIPAGQFEMGSPLNELNRAPNEAQHRVRLTKAFYMSIHEVTNAEYRRFKASHNSGAYRGVNCNDDHQPVVMVGHANAEAYAAWLSKRKRGHTYRLPTEAEWEYACRAGSTTAYWWGDIREEGFKYANGNDPETKRAFNHDWESWPKDDGHRVAAPGGKYPPNRFGLYDMAGNVFEWCHDWYEEGYEKSPPTDPRGPTIGTEKIIRGGSWYHVMWDHRSAARTKIPTTVLYQFVGIRLVLECRPKK